MYVNCLCLKVVLEPLDGHNEGIFFLSLSRPEARNSIGRQFLRVSATGGGVLRSVGAVWQKWLASRCMWQLSRCSGWVAS